MTIVGLEMQELFFFILLLSYRIFRTALNDINMVPKYAHKFDIHVCVHRKYNSEL